MDFEEAEDSLIVELGICHGGAAVACRGNLEKRVAIASGVATCGLGQALGVEGRHELVVLRVDEQDGHARVRDGRDGACVRYVVAALAAAEHEAGQVKQGVRGQGLALGAHGTHGKDGLVPEVGVGGIADDGLDLLREVLLG